MPEPQLTIRQQITQRITETRSTARELSSALGVPEIQIDDHMPHILKSVSRDTSRRFVMEPASCHECGYQFMSRTKLTRPSKCPRCRGKKISAPRYGIESHNVKAKS